VAFPWIFEDNFESGDNSGWDSETDTVSQLDFPHYSTLAGLPWSTAAPYSGAYCMRATLAGGTATAYVQEGDVNISAAAQSFIQFNIWFSPNFTGTADDTVEVLNLQNGSNVDEVVFGFRIVAATNVINLGIGETAPTSFSSQEIERGIWYTVELDITLDAGGGNDGTVDIYVTKEDELADTAVAATQVSSLDQAAVTHARLGITGHLATTTGTILFDNFVQDDARVYPPVRRYDNATLLTKSGHVFIGRGTIDNVSLLSGSGTGNVLTVYDTDTADVNDASNIVVELKNTASDELVDPAGTPMTIINGAYISLSGTNPRALVKTCNVHAMSTANVRNIGVNKR